MKEVSEQQKENLIESSSRRKAVKTIVGGVTALAAYNLLPARWGKPYVESVFLPAHAATSGESGYEYVGSWQVNDGPNWGTSPQCYTGQEAAALLFGGNASDYAISTVSDQVADIDFQAYVDIHSGVSTIVAHDYSVDTGGAGYETVGDTSAYITDHNVTDINYAFRLIS